MTNIPVRRLAVLVDDGDVFAEVGAELDAGFVHFVVLQGRNMKLSHGTYPSVDHFWTISIDPHSSPASRARLDDISGWMRMVNEAMYDFMYGYRAPGQVCGGQSLCVSSTLAILRTFYSAEDGKAFQIFDGLFQKNDPSSLPLAVPPSPVKSLFDCNLLPTMSLLGARASPPF